MSAKVSLEQTNLTAPLKSPSSSLQDTRKAKELAGSFKGRDLLERLLDLPLIWAERGIWSASSTICFLTVEVKEQVWSRLAGVLRHRGLKCNKRTQAAGVFSLTTDWRMAASFFAAGALQDRGIHFRIFTAVLRWSTEEDVGGLGIALELDGRQSGLDDRTLGAGSCTSSSSFSHLPFFIGTQLVHFLLSLTHLQFLHLPRKLHVKQAGMTHDIIIIMTLLLLLLIINSWPILFIIYHHYRHALFTYCINNIFMY